MMNVVNSVVASKADAAASTSGKGTRSAGDDGFARTLNSYGDGQGKSSKAASDDSDEGSTSSAQSGQGKSATDTASAKTGSDAEQSAAATGNALLQATSAQDGQVLDPTLADAVVEIPVDDIQVPQQPVTSDATDADLNAATDLLADLQAAIPVPTKGQGSPVRNATTDQSKTEQTDASADATDADTGTVDAVTGDVLAILQAMPEVPIDQSAQSNVGVDPQQAVQSQVDGVAAKVDTDVLASRASDTGQVVAPDNSSSTATPATTSDSTRTAKTTASAADAVAAVHDALDHDDDASSDIEMPSVTVTDSRRFVGLAPSSNAVSLATAFGKDPDWSAAMDPSAKLSNEALYASTGKVVNTLKIELNPNDLGHVTATMRMVGEELNIHLTVESSKAYKQLTSDSSSMLDSLKAQGYSVDQITVSIASSSGSSSSNKGDDQSANGRQSSDMGQAQQQQQQQQNGRQGGNFGRSMADTPDIIVRGSSSGGSDDSLAQGTAGRGTDSRPDHVYL